MTNTKKLTKIAKSVTFTVVTGSSLIESYARQTGDLALKLRNGSTYIYKGVDEKTYTDFLAAQSKGTFFGANIRNKFVAEQAE